MDIYKYQISTQIKEPEIIQNLLAFDVPSDFTE